MSPKECWMPPNRASIVCKSSDVGRSMLCWKYFSNECILTDGKRRAYEEGGGRDGGKK